MKKLLLILVLSAFGLVTVSAQSTYKLVPSATKNLVKGTSNLHDWRCIVEQQSGTAVINTAGAFEIKSLNVKMVTKSIKSIKENGSYYEEGMDKNTYKALQADKFPEIVYTLADITGVKTTGNTSNFHATGNLTVADKTNKLTFPVKATVEGNKVVFTGSVKFKMTAFGIAPPKALLGTIKCGDEVTIVLNTTFQK